MKTINLPIDNEFADDLVARMLKEHTAMIKSNIAELKRKKKLEYYEQEELDYIVKLFEALKVVNDYFGN
jgi:predicted metal-dependent hydrolase